MYCNARQKCFILQKLDGSNTGKHLLNCNCNIKTCPVMPLWLYVHRSLAVSRYGTSIQRCSFVNGWSGEKEVPRAVPGGRNITKKKKIIHIPYDGWLLTAICFIMVILNWLHLKLLLLKIAHCYSKDRIVLEIWYGVQGFIRHRFQQSLKNCVDINQLVESLVLICFSITNWFGKLRLLRVDWSDWIIFHYSMHIFIRPMLKFKSN